MMRHTIEQTINLLFNVVMGIVLGISGQVMQGICAPLSFIQTFCLTMGVGFLLGTYIPAEKIGQTFASLFGLKKGIGNYFVSTLAISFVMINFVSLTSIFIQAGTMALTVYQMMILPFLTVGIIAIEASFWLIQRLVVKYYTRA